MCSLPPTVGCSPRFRAHEIAYSQKYVHIEVKLLAKHPLEYRREDFDAPHCLVAPIAFDHPLQNLVFKCLAIIF